MNEIREQIERLRNGIRWGLQNHPEMPIICEKAADTMDALLARNELLEAVLMAASLASDTSEDHLMIPERHTELMIALAAAQTMQTLNEKDSA